MPRLMDPISRNIPFIPSSFDKSIQKVFKFRRSTVIAWRQVNPLPIPQAIVEDIVFGESGDSRDSSKQNIAR